MMRHKSLMRELVFFWMILLAATTVGATGAWIQERNPFVGTWKANLAKSKQHPNHLFKSATIRFEVSDDVVLLTYSGVSMSGQQESATRKLHSDGKAQGRRREGSRV